MTWTPSLVVGLVVILAVTVLAVAGVIDGEEALAAILGLGGGGGLGVAHEKQRSTS